MMTHHLTVKARSTPEILERILRVIRYRGFQLCAVTARNIDAAQMICVVLTVSGSHPLDILLNQLGKLVDVVRVEMRQQVDAEVYESSM